MASPEGIMSQNLSLHMCVLVTWMHSNVLRRWDSQGRLLPFVLPRVAIAHRGPVRALDRSPNAVSSSKVNVQHSSSAAVHRSSIKAGRTKGRSRARSCTRP